jgi:hypothetical protein
MENSSLEITELTDVLFDPKGPSIIGLELQVIDNDVSVETQLRDLFEFLLNILVIGIVKLRLNLCVETIQDESVQNALQHYFDRINVNVYMKITENEMIDTEPYCKINYNDSRTHPFSLSILQTVVQATHLEDMSAVYDLSNGYGEEKMITISFGFK